MMADKHNLNYEVRELKLGASFTSNKASQYHTIKYDFKPASVDVNKMASVDVGTNNQVTVTVPHLDGAGVPQTVFKGNQRPYTKECVLIIDRGTGEITLEKLSSNIQVKKTRQETSQKPLPPSAVPGELTNTTQRSSSRTRVATNRRTNPHNAVAGAPPQSSQGRFPPGAAKPPSSIVRSPQRTRTSPPQAAPWSAGGNSTMASLPMIGLDDALGTAQPTPTPTPTPTPAPLPTLNGYANSAPQRLPERHSYAPERQERPERQDRPERQERQDRPERQDRQDRPERQERQERQDRPPAALAPVNNHVTHNPPSQDSSSSSSSDSDSGSGSDSDSDADDTAVPPAQNGTTNSALPSDVLNDDLCLSESGSDSD